MSDGRKVGGARDESRESEGKERRGSSESEGW